MRLQGLFGWWLQCALRDDDFYSVISANSPVPEDQIPSALGDGRAPFGSYKGALKRIVWLIYHPNANAWPQLHGRQPRCVLGGIDLMSHGRHALLTIGR